LGSVVLWFLGSWLGAMIWLVWFYKKATSVLFAFLVTVFVILLLEIIPGYLVQQTLQTYILVHLAFGYAIIGFALVGVGDGNNQKAQKPNSKVHFVNAKWAEGTEGHGLILTVKGTKEASFTANQITLQIEGDSFWQAVGSGTGGSALVTLAKWSFLPLSLCPKYMSANSVPKNNENFVFSVGIGTKQNGTFGAQYSTVTGRLNDLIKAGDPPLNLIFEGDGTLMFGLTLLPSRLSECLSNKNNNFPLLFSSPFPNSKNTDEAKEKKKIKKGKKPLKNPKENKKNDNGEGLEANEEDTGENLEEEEEEDKN